MNACNIFYLIKLLLLLPTITIFITITTATCYHMRLWLIPITYGAINLGDLIYANKYVRR